MSVSDSEKLKQLLQIQREDDKKMAQGDWSPIDQGRAQSFIQADYFHIMQGLEFSDEFTKNSIHANLHALCSSNMIPGGLTSIQIMFLACLNGVKRHLQDKFTRTQKELFCIWSAIPESIRNDFDQNNAKAWEGFDSLVQDSESWGRTPEEFEECVLEIVRKLTEIYAAHQLFVEALRNKLRE